MNPWNQLVNVFGSTWDEEKVSGVAADNICIAWPSILQCIHNWQCDLSNKTALDFGCGGGLFCRKLSQLGLQVTGCDEASELLHVARGNNYATTTICDCERVYQSDEQFDLITSIMVFQFVEDMHILLQKLLSKLKPNGLLVFSVFNPQFVVHTLNGRMHSSLPGNTVDTLSFKGELHIPVFNRDALEYQSLLGEYGLCEMYRDYPPFTPEFLHEYDMPFSVELPEYLIQGFVKGALPK